MENINVLGTQKDAKTIINNIKNNLDVLTPREISDYTIYLAVEFGKFGQDLAQADFEYAKKWLELRQICETDKQAEMKAKATQEYHTKKKLEYVVKGIKETIQALKKRQAVLSDEAKNQY